MIELSGEYHDDVGRLMEEIDRLQSFKTAYMEWSEKTDWVQDSATSKELGKHRADVIKDRFEVLNADAQRYRWLADNDQLDPRYQHEALTIAFSDLAGSALDGVVDSIIRQHTDK